MRSSNACDVSSRHNADAADNRGQRSQAAASITGHSVAAGQGHCRGILYRIADIYPECHSRRFALLPPQEIFDRLRLKRAFIGRVFPRRARFYRRADAIDDQRHLHHTS